jgi:RNA polymerase sigma-70 factor (ECF subfamily)
VTPFPSPLVQPETSRAESGHDQISDFSWTALYGRIRDEHPEALGELYRRLQSHRYRFFGQLDVADAQDALHQCYLEVLDQIQRGNVREPERMDGYIAVVARRLICRRIMARIQGRGCVRR